MHTLWLKVGAAAAVLTLSGCIETVADAWRRHAAQHAQRKGIGSRRVKPTRADQAVMREGEAHFSD